LPKKNQQPTPAAFTARLPLALGKRFEAARTFLLKQKEIVEDVCFYGPSTGWALRYRVCGKPAVCPAPAQRSPVAIVSLEAAASTAVDWQALSPVANAPRGRLTAARRSCGSTFRCRHGRRRLQADSSAPSWRPWRPDKVEKLGGQPRRLTETTMADFGALCVLIAFGGGDLCRRRRHCWGLGTPKRDCSSPAGRRLRLGRGAGLSSVAMVQSFVSGDFSIKYVQPLLRRAGTASLQDLGVLGRARRVHAVLGGAAGRVRGHRGVQQPAPPT